MENIKEKKKEKRKKRRPIKLPKKILVYKNPDKSGWTEKWTQSRDWLNFPAPFRMVLMATPSKGKTLTVMNIICRLDPPPDYIFVIHCDAGCTKEYNALGDIELLNEIPPVEFWRTLPEGSKKLVIIDDMEISQLSKEGLRRLNRLFGYVSTHCNVNIMLTSQQPYDIPSIVRRCANVFVLWSYRDLNVLSDMARKSGLTAKDFKYLFENIITEKYDNLWIDCTEGSPAPLRKNGYELIELK